MSDNDNDRSIRVAEDGVRVYLGNRFTPGDARAGHGQLILQIQSIHGWGCAEMTYGEATELASAINDAIRLWSTGQ
jgi:hypothetical protein